MEKEHLIPSAPKPVPPINSQHGYAPPPPQYGYQGQPGYHSTQDQSTTQPQTVTTTVLPAPPDYMVLSFFSCLCCCWPMGLVAIILSSQARSLYLGGNYEEAIVTAQHARNCAYVAIAFGISVIIVVIIVTTSG